MKWNGSEFLEVGGALMAQVPRGSVLEPNLDPTPEVGASPPRAGPHLGPPLGLHQKPSLIWDASTSENSPRGLPRCFSAGLLDPQIGVGPSGLGSRTGAEQPCLVSRSGQLAQPRGGKVEVWGLLAPQRRDR